MGRGNTQKFNILFLVLRFEHFLLWKSSVFGLYLNINNVRSLIDCIAPAVILRNTHSILSQIPYKAPSVCRCLGTRQKTRLMWSPWSKTILSSLSCCFQNQVNSYNFPPQKAFWNASEYSLAFFAGNIKKVGCCNEYLEAIISPRFTNNERVRGPSDSSVFPTGFSRCTVHT